MTQTLRLMRGTYAEAFCMARKFGDGTVLDSSKRSSQEQHHCRQSGRTLGPPAMSTTTLCAIYDPDAPLGILAATKSTVSIFVHWHEHEYLDHETEDEADADDGKVIRHGSGSLRLSRKMYSAAMTEWLNEKTLHCTGGQYAGEGFISFDEVERLPLQAPVVAYMTDSPSTTEKKVLVQGFGTTRETDFCVEMEFGAAPAAAVAAEPVTEEEAVAIKAASKVGFAQRLASESFEDIKDMLVIVQSVFDRAVAAAAVTAETDTTETPVSFFRKSLEPADAS